MLINFFKNLRKQREFLNILKLFIVFLNSGITNSVSSEQHSKCKPVLRLFGQMIIFGQVRCTILPSHNHLLDHIAMLIGVGKWEIGAYHLTCYIGATCSRRLHRAKGCETSGCFGG